MAILPDDRAVSEVLGSILVFALVLSVLVIIQVAGVPAANQQIEFEHNARVQGDFQDFDQNVDRAAALGSGSSAAVETGVRYPPRLFLVNPGPAAGTITTSSPSAVEFRNVKSVNEETNDFFNATRQYTTTTFSYGPSYNEYASAPTTTYEHGVLYNSDDSGAAVFADGNLVSGNRITLTMLEGSLSESSTKSVTLQTVPISAPSQTVSVQGAKGNPLELEVYTGLSENTWRDHILADELTSAGQGGHVTSVECQSGVNDDDPCNGQLLIELEPGVTYNVRLAKVGVGSGFPDESAAYVTTVSDLDVAVTTVGGTVTAEVRDQFNNPIAGETLYFYSPDGTFPNGVSDVSNEKGRVAAKFVPGADVQESTIFVGTTQRPTGQVDTDDPTQYVKYGVSVTDAPNTEDSGQINPNERDGNLVLQSVEQGDTQQTSGQFTLRFDNTGTSTATVNEVRLPFYYNAKPGLSSGPGSATISDGSETVTAVVRGQYVIVPNNFTVNSGQQLVLDVQFYEGPNPVISDPYTEANADDFFVLTGIISGTPQNYFVAPGSVQVEPNVGPTATITGVQDTSRDQQNNKKAEFKVSWAAADTDGTVTQLDVTATSTTVPSHTTTTTITDPSATGTTTISITDAADTPFGEEYTITVTATDDDGESTTDSTTQFANGDDTT